MARWTCANEAAAIAFLSNYSKNYYGFLPKSSSIVTLIYSKEIEGPESCKIFKTYVNSQGTTFYKFPKYWPSFKYIPLFFWLNKSILLATLECI